nr:MAG TPA: hypothetical protein [Caudoviricetes sp.]
MARSVARPRVGVLGSIPGQGAGLPRRWPYLEM